MTEGKLYGVCNARERTTGSKYSVNNRGRKCTGQAAAIPVEGCRCGVSPIMSTIIQRYRNERKFGGHDDVLVRRPHIDAYPRGRPRSRVCTAPSPFVLCSSWILVHDAPTSLSLSPSLPLSFSPDSSWFSSVPDRNRSRSSGRRFVPVSETAIYINLDADGFGVPLIG